MSGRNGSINRGLISKLFQQNPKHRHSGKEHYADLLYRVQTTTGQPGHVYLLFEHKSRQHPLIALDLLRYMIGIWGQAVKSGQGAPLASNLAHCALPWAAGVENRHQFW